VMLLQRPMRIIRAGRHHGQRAVHRKRPVNRSS
jgi:hypothetical protein